jgi:hypothetical protein
MKSIQKTFTSRYIYLAFAVIIYTSKAWAGPGNDVWKKQVARVIDLADNQDEKVHHLKGQNLDSSLVDILISAVRSNKFPAYSTSDLTINNKISTSDFNALTTPIKDTVITVDPVTRKEKMSIVTQDLNTEKIHKYRVIENWSFNTATGKTDIEIVAVAPLMEVWSGGRVLIGVKAWFYVKYADLEKAYIQSKKNSPIKSFANYIWEDYFLNETKPKENK